MRKRWWEHSGWFGGGFGDGGGADVEDRLKHIERKVDAIMATLEELTAILNDIGTEVGKVSADTDNLLASLQAILNNPPSGLSAEQQAALDAAVASATAIRDSLKALDDKVPDPVPATPPAAPSP